ncbi:MAG: DUF3048 C-terminal domain-containing protein [Clostridia bacterium]|nr:DUF3048 C-terminal domain-containing protein [Clostridia bacterium]
MLLLILLSLVFQCTGCGKLSFLPSLDGESPPPANDPTGDSTQTLAPADPPPPTYYNRYTGLACDEAVSSCRPISVCIGNFDQKQQEGLSFADILIEAPVDGDKTRLWALCTNPTGATKLSSVASVREYMMPISYAFGAICAYNGTTDTAGVGTTVFQGDTLDYLHHNLVGSFTGNGDGTLSTTGSALWEAAKSKGYSLSTSGCTLPYRFPELGSTHTPTGNLVNSIHFGFSGANTVTFSYDADKNVYLRAQSGVAHVDALTGEQLAYTNVLLLFHNVSYYHSPTETTFALDSASGGDGYAYTGGGVSRVHWSFAEDGSLRVSYDDGTPITLNRGKTYIGMLRITDSATLIAK